MRRTFALTSRIADHAVAFVDGGNPLGASGGRGSDSGSGEPAVPRQASTVVLVRDGDSGPQAFVMRRQATMAFAARQHVFPGGGVDLRDCDPDVPWGGPPLPTWAERLGVEEPGAAGLVCAAVRELFEECGVLLAGAGPQDVVADLSDQSWEVDRLALLDRSLALSELLQRRGLILRTDLLTAWSRWCTPVFEPRRYDTWFFVAALPTGQLAREVGGEADHAEWLDASAAAIGGADGSLAMMPPTIVTLEEVADHPDVASLLRCRRSVRQVMPWLVRAPDSLSIQVDIDGDGGGQPGPPSGLEDLR
ncbi:NUDIX hydrolase [Angustibacter sp. McL0619]|uniref:NUDIX hydrolase n=1 Tax=Angustibacter sp. McL0619 TaxID=3415676 RepID=UPI003CF272F8